MSEPEPPMSPDLQEARSIRYANLLAIAKLSSGRWAVYTTTGLGNDQFRNDVQIADQLDPRAITARAEAELAQRLLEDEEYERRLELGPGANVAKATLEDMGL